MGVPSDVVSKLHALPGLASARTVATLLGLKPSTIYKLVRQHEIPSFRVGYSVRLDPAAVALWLQERSVK